ncbi:MAG: TlyA family RNA methyltransferase [Tindallia sp. MSAO_Bac2]|nr:MAG: TlyA family RNA methyltransferase [Tindallia sp. MSAO_Bac2]
MKKQRIDVLLVEKGFFKSREKARSALMAGLIKVDNMPVEKAGAKVDEEAEIVVKGTDIPYVSRGGLKLEKALNSFKLSLKDKVCLDIGASTGGFTDCMLKNGANKVYAIDVGYGQLDWSLRKDERVVVMERTNIRYVQPDQLEEAADFASVDVSFISLKLVLPVVTALIKPGSYIVALIKPQFEAGRELVGKNGVVRDASVHQQVIEKILNLCPEWGLKALDLTFSPIKGPKGNVEFLLLAQKAEDGISIADHVSIDNEKVTAVVNESQSHQF